MPRAIPTASEMHSDTSGPRSTAIRRSLPPQLIAILPAYPSPQLFALLAATDVDRPVHLKDKHNTLMCIAKYSIFIHKLGESLPLCDETY